MSQLDREITSCTKCPATLVEYRWTPISYFGEISKANAWTISINPSAREFTDSKATELTGPKQRFARVADFPDCSSRSAVAEHHLDTVLDMQHTVLRRAPYRNYFARLGRFIALASARHGEIDPLSPYTDGVQFGKSKLLFCHLDIAKCATKKPWSDLSAADKRTLIGNCSPYLEKQIRSSPQLRLILVNGRTAYDECLPLMKRLGFDGIEQKVTLGSSSTCIASGTLHTRRSAVKMVAWTANVVNGHMNTAGRAALAHAVGAALRDGR
jgi:hypothetical protein